MRLLICTLLFAALPAIASVSVDVDITSSIELKTDGVYTRGRRNPKNDPRSFQVVVESKAKESNIATSGTTTLTATRNYTNGLTRAESILKNPLGDLDMFYVTPRTLNINYDFVTDGNGTALTIDIKDQQPTIGWKQKKGKRTEIRDTVKSQNDIINGTINVNYTFGPNEWATLVYIQDMHELFSSHIPGTAKGSPVFNYSQTFIGTANPNFAAVKKKWMILWGAPGQKVSLRWAYGNLSFGREAEGRLKIGFVKPVALLNQPIQKDALLKNIQDFNATKTLKSDTFKIASESLNEGAVKLISQTHGPLPKVSEDSPFYMTLKLLSLVNDEKALRNFYTSLSFSKFASTLEVLMGLSYYSATAPETMFLWDIKAATTLFSLYGANLESQNLKPLCSAVEVDLPFQEKKAKVIGFQIYIFLMTKASHRLKYYSFAPAKALLEGIIENEKKGKTYKQVMADQVEAEKIVKAYNLLSESGKISRRAFNTAMHEIKLIYKKFDNLGSTEDTTNRVLQELANLVDAEDTFFNQLADRLKMFGAHSTQAVKASDLLGMIKSTDVKRRKTLDLMKHQLRYVSSEDTGLQSSSSNFINTVTSLYMHYVKFMNEKGDNSFEQIRTSAASAYNLQETMDIMEPCLAGLVDEKK